MLAQHLGHAITGDLTTYMEAGDAKTGHSKMFGEADLPRLWAQGAPSFFARKWPTTPKIDRAIADRIGIARGVLSSKASGGGGAKGPGKGGGKGAGKGAGAPRAHRTE